MVKFSYILSIIQTLIALSRLEIKTSLEAENVKLVIQSASLPFVRRAALLVSLSPFVFCWAHVGYFSNFFMLQSLARSFAEPNISDYLVLFKNICWLVQLANSILGSGAGATHHMLWVGWDALWLRFAFDFKALVDWKQSESWFATAT